MGGGQAISKVQIYFQGNPQNFSKSQFLGGWRSDAQLSDLPLDESFREGAPSRHETCKENEQVKIIYSNDFGKPENKDHVSCLSSHTSLRKVLRPRALHRGGAWNFFNVSKPISRGESHYYDIYDSKILYSFKCINTLIISTYYLDSA